MGKINKKKLQFAAAAAILLLAGGFYAIVNSMEFADEESLEQIQAFYLSEDEVTGLGWKNGDGEELSFTKSGEEWSSPEEPDKDVNMIKFGDALSAACDIKAEDTVSSVSDMSVYGLSEPRLTIELEFSEGEKDTITVGDMNEMTGDYYIRINNDSDIYTVDSSFINNFGFDVTEFTEENATDSEASESASDESKSVANE